MSNLNGDGKGREMEPELLTAYALGQLEGEELEQGARAASGEAVQQDIGGIRKVAEAVAASRNAEALPETSAALRERIEARLLETATKVVPPKFVEAGGRQRMGWQRVVAVMCLGGGVCGLLLAVSYAVVATRYRHASWSLARLNDALASTISAEGVTASAQPPAKEKENALRYQSPTDEAAEAPAEPYQRFMSRATKLPTADFESAEARPTATGEKLAQVPKKATDVELRSEVTSRGGTGGPAPVAVDPFAVPPDDIPGSQPYVPPTNFAIRPRTQAAPSGTSMAGGGYGTADGYAPDVSGRSAYGPTPGGIPALPSSMARGGRDAAKSGEDYLELAENAPRASVDALMPPAPTSDSGAGADKSGATNRFANARPGLSSPGSGKAGQPGQRPEARTQLAVGNELEVREPALALKKTDGLDRLADGTRRDGELVEFELRSEAKSWSYRQRGVPGTEQYEPIVENAFLDPRRQPLSTFAIDVDTASYANVRRFLTSGRLPPANAVRIEELVNYFRYDYPQPKGNEPFSVNMEVAECPWAGGTLTPALSQREREKGRGHLLLRVGLKGKEVARGQRPASNLVFLLDVSGSMADANKLPLLKTAMQMLVRELGENDRVSIVTYAGEAGLRLAPTRGHEQEKIHSVIESLTSGGSTNGSAGIELAYEQAGAYFEQGGTNRVILCTDGDLNVGVTSDDALVELIKKKAKSGTFLTVLGFGEGNLKDAKMEKLADNGNGLYAYIDSVREARKVLVEQLTGSTITIAKDVKIQIEFNPAEIASYRLLGYENRVMAAQDFNNDKKDAGEIGAGHTVTALYELVPVGADSEPERTQKGVDPLRYQRSEVGGQRSEGRGTGDRRQETGGKLTEVAKTGELLTLKLRYKEPEGNESTLREYPLKDKAHSFRSASPDMQFAVAVASFGMILRGSEHRGNGNLAAVSEIAAGALGNDPGGYRAEFLDLVRRAQSLGADPGSAVRATKSTKNTNETTEQAEKKSHAEAPRRRASGCL